MNPILSLASTEQITAELSVVSPISKLLDDLLTKIIFCLGNEKSREMRSVCRKFNRLFCQNIQIAKFCKVEHEKAQGVNPQYGKTTILQSLSGNFCKIRTIHIQFNGDFDLFIPKEILKLTSLEALILNLKKFSKDFFDDICSPKLNSTELRSYKDQIDEKLSGNYLKIRLSSQA